MFSAFTTVLLMWSLTSNHWCIDALEGILQTVLGHQQLFFWFPSLSNGQTEYKNQVMDTALQCLVSLLLGTMGCNGGGVCPQHINHRMHWPVSFPGWIWLSATTVPCLRKGGCLSICYDQAWAQTHSAPSLICHPHSHIPHQVESQKLCLG